jgi:hypothetical protein
MIDNELKSTIEKLMVLDDISWGKVLLSRDPLFDKINAEDVERFIDDAHACAESLFQKHIGLTDVAPSVFAKKENITIKVDDAPPMEEYLYFGHYFHQPPTIEVSQLALEKVTGVMQEMDMAMEKVNLQELIMAHEIFHYLKAKFSLEQKASVTIPLFGKLKRTYRVKRVEEVAAVRFSKLWLGLSFCPAIFDILLIYSVNPERAKRLSIEQLKKGGRID